MLKKVLIACLILSLLCTSVFATEKELSCKSALLMDYTSGKILYELNPHEKMPIASVTKVMTMLLTMEEIEKGNLKYTDIVTASAYAKSMGGSTIFLDEGEEISVDDLLKGIAVASGNDACVAIAEHISGNCTDFVARMNKRARELGMENTNFVNCNGLDAPEHYSTAYDVALMSRELMNHEDIFRYTTIWMDSLRNGEFTLSNTNKLVRFYDGCTGLKTGSTSKAGFCISATAKRNGLHLISVIMNAPTSKERQADASALLNYGFSKYKNVTMIKKERKAKDIPVIKGKKENAPLEFKNDVIVLCEKDNSEKIDIEYIIKENPKAPIKKGEKAGEALCKLNNEVVGRTDIIFADDIEEIDLLFSYGKIVDIWLGNK